MSVQMDKTGMRGKYRRFVFLVTASTMILVMLLSLLKLALFPTYESSVNILLKPGREEIYFAREIGTYVGSDPTKTITTTYSEILIGRRICERVIDEMLRDGYRFETEREGFSASLWDEYLEPASLKLLEWYFILNFGSFKGFPTPTEKLVNNLQKNLDAEGLLNTYIIKISLAWDDPAVASDILNKLANVFVEYHRSRTHDDLAVLLTGFKGELASRTEALTSAEAALKEYQENFGIVMLSKETRLRLERLSDLDYSIQQTRANLEELKGEALGLEKEIMLLGAGYVSLPGVEVDPEVSRFLYEVERLEGELAGLEKGSSEYSGTAEELSEYRDRLRERIVLLFGSSLTAEYPQYGDLSGSISLVRAEEVAVTARLKALEALEVEEQVMLEDLPDLELDYARLSREVSAAESRVMELERRIEDIRIAKAVDLSEFTLMQAALPMKYPNDPQLLLNLLLSFVGGLILSLIPILLIEFYNKPVWTVSDVSGILPETRHLGTFGSWGGGR